MIRENNFLETNPLKLLLRIRIITKLVKPINSGNKTKNRYHNSPGPITATRHLALKKKIIVQMRTPKT